MKAIAYEKFVGVLSNWFLFSKVSRKIFLSESFPLARSYLHLNKYRLFIELLQTFTN